MLDYSYGDYTYNPGTFGSSTGAGLLGGILGAVLAVTGVICLVIAIFTIIGMWKVLKKGGEPGWGALIPIYNQYLLCKITGVSPWWLLIVFLGGFIGLIPVLGSLVYSVAVIYFLVLLYVSLARSFGKSDGFAVGLILLSPIFMFVLGIKGEYQGPKPMNDIIFKKKEESASPAPNYSAPASETNQQPAAGAKFCTSCGQPVNADSKFCTNCGKEI